MKLATTLIFLLSLVSVENIYATDFRKSNWGDSQEQVEAVEGKPAHKENGLLGYSVTVGGLKAMLGYKFVGGQLVSGTYMFTEPHSNDLLYVEDFKSLSGLLTAKYGNAAMDREVWKDDLYKSHPNEYGTAVAAGRLTYIARWDDASSRTEITHLLRGDNFKISHILLYVGSEFKDLESSHRASEKMDGL